MRETDKEMTNHDSGLGDEVDKLVRMTKKAEGVGGEVKKGSKVKRERERERENRQ